MTKHIVCIAVEVDERYTAFDVKKEIEYVIPFCSSELLDTLTGVHVARNPSKTYQVWNKDHVAMYADVTVDSWEELVKVEEDTGNSFSSYITTDDIESVVTAVQNEWNGDLEYHLIGGA
jgi:hypothetical protein